jgi:kynurenine formamidase
MKAPAHDRNHQPWLSDAHIVDLTWPIGAQLPVAQEYPAVVVETPFSIEAGDVATAELIHMGIHVGTHVDAPAHFHAGQPTIDEVEALAFSGSAVVIEIEDLDRGWQEITADDIVQCEARIGERIGAGDIALFRTGFARKWAKLPPGPRGRDTGWPFLGSSAIDLLLSRKVKAVGVETPDPDRREPTTNEAHHRLLGAGVFIIESLARLDEIPAPRCLFLALGLPFSGCTGSPVRALALSWEMGSPQAPSPRTEAAT